MSDQRQTSGELQFLHRGLSVVATWCGSCRNGKQGRSGCFYISWTSGELLLIWGAARGFLFQPWAGNLNLSISKCHMWKSCSASSVIRATSKIAKCLDTSAICVIMLPGKQKGKERQATQESCFSDVSLIEGNLILQSLIQSFHVALQSAWHCFINTVL